MDSLAGFLDGPRARGAFLLRSILDPPWAIRIEDEAPLTLLTVVRGRAWISPDDAEPVEVRDGDCVVLRGPDHYTAADALTTTPQIVIHPGQRCTTTDGEDVFTEMSLGIRTWGNTANGSTMLLTGTYTSEGEVSRPLREILPEMILVRSEDVHPAVTAMLAEEITGDDPGQDSVLDRLLDVLLVLALRSWFMRPDAKGHRWYTTYSDPIVGPALRLMHDRPSHPWTVASLATAVGASRAAFARRFTELVGRPPIAYLTAWRLSLAADLVLDSTKTISAVARHVGYGSAYSLSTAFKRAYGMSPTSFRRTRSGD